jgi:AraC-like DNA-binding protein
VLREQPTLRKALEAMLSYSWAENQALTLKLEVLHDVAILREGTASTIGRQTGEMVLGALTLIIRRLVAATWRPQEVHFTHSRPDDIAAHRRVFGVTPLFGQEFDGLLIDARDVEAPIAGADPVAAARALRYLDLEASVGGADPTAAVRDLILALLPTGTCTVDRVAAHLGVSRRTLSRRLAGAGAPTFTELLDDIRVGLARRYLAAGRHSLTEIAERLGYGSLSAFSRWRRFNLVADRGQTRLARHTPA